MSYTAHRRGEQIRAKLVLILLILVLIPTAKAAPRSELIDFWNDTEPSSTIQVDHSIWQELLTTYVDDNHESGINRFDYAAVTANDAGKLKRYLAYLQKIEPRQLNRQEAMAYWLNMFNAILIERVVDTYQSGSRRAINRINNGGLRSVGWGRKAVEVAMQDISLNDIEHGILRPIWDDPRIHFAITACTLGGANIQKTAFDGENNEQLLEKAKNEFLQHPRAISVDGNRIILNSVFDWYVADFGGNKRAMLSYIRENANEEIRQSIQGLTRTRYEYDWTLNSPTNLSGSSDDDE